MNAPTFCAAKPWDPYASWFGITDESRPLNAYQLLGLPELENDPRRIRIAAERRMAQLQSHAETDEQLWDDIQRELIQAIETLTDPQEKGIVDAAIRRRQKRAAILQHLPMPEGQVLRCSSCDTENTGSRRFCSSCGDALWTVCTTCENVCPTCETFCGSCGTNHSAALAQCLKASEKRIDEANHLAERSQLHAALQVVEQIATSEDPRLEPFIQRALELRYEWRRMQREQQQANSHRQQQALEAWRSGQNDAAMRILETIPESALADECRHILAATRQQQQQIADLATRLRDAVQGKSLSTAAQLVDQLLVLRPEHAQATRLAHRLAKALQQRARKYQQEGDYSKSFALLEQTPQAGRGEDFHAAWEQAAEQLALMTHLQQAPRIDPVVLGLAARMAKLVPVDTRVADIRRRMHQLAKATPPHDPPPWALQPQRTDIGVPVHLWANPRRINIAPECIPALNGHMGKMAVALGLALQGLDAAQLALNLHSKQRSLLGSLPLAGRRPAAASWGIDIGQTAVKAVRLVRQREGQFHVDRVHCLPYSQAISCTVSGEQAELEIRTALNALLKHADFRKERICVNLPATATMVTVAGLPPAGSKQLREVALYEAKRMFPLSLDDLCWDYQCMSTDSAEARNADVVTIFAAAKRQIVNDKLQMSRGLVNIDVVQSSLLALHNLFAFEMMPISPEHAIAVVDVGAANTNFVVLAANTLWHRSLPFCSSTLAHGLAREFRLTQAQAEALMRAPHTADRIRPVLHYLRRAYRNLSADLRRTIEFFHREHPSLTLQQVVLVGGAAHTPGLLQHLWYGDAG